MEEIKKSLISWWSPNKKKTESRIHVVDAVKIFLKEEEKLKNLILAIYDNEKDETKKQIFITAFYYFLKDSTLFKIDYVILTKAVEYIKEKENNITEELQTPWRIACLTGQPKILSHFFKQLESKADINDREQKKLEQRLCGRIIYELLIIAEIVGAKIDFTQTIELRFKGQLTSFFINLEAIGEERLRRYLTRKAKELDEGKGKEKEEEEEEEEYALNATSSSSPHYSSDIPNKQEHKVLQEGEGSSTGNQEEIKLRDETEQDSREAAKKRADEAKFEDDQARKRAKEEVAKFQPEADKASREAAEKRAEEAEARRQEDKKARRKAQKEVAKFQPEANKASREAAKKRAEEAEARRQEDKKARRKAQKEVAKFQPEADKASREAAEKRADEAKFEDDQARKRAKEEVAKFQPEADKASREAAEKRADEAKFEDDQARKRAKEEVAKFQPEADKASREAAEKRAEEAEARRQEDKKARRKANEEVRLLQAKVVESMAREAETGSQERENESKKGNKEEQNNTAVTLPTTRENPAPANTTLDEKLKDEPISAETIKKAETRRIIATMRSDIRNYDWKVSFGGKKYEGKVYPQHAYDILIKTQQTDKDRRNSYNDVDVLLVSNEVKRILKKAVDETQDLTDKNFFKRLFALIKQKLSPVSESSTSISLFRKANTQTNYKALKSTFVPRLTSAPSS